MKTALQNHNPLRGGGVSSTQRHFNHRFMLRICANGHGPVHTSARSISILLR